MQAGAPDTGQAQAGNQVSMRGTLKTLCWRPCIHLDDSRSWDLTLGAPGTTEGAEVRGCVCEGRGGRVPATPRSTCLFFLLPFTGGKTRPA